MALPASGPLSIQQINAEFGRGNDLNSYRGTTWYTDAGGSGTFSTGAISIGDFFGKRASSPSFSFTIGSHQANANLRTLAVNAGWNQSSPVTATIAGGIYIYSTGVGTPALTINGSFPGGVTLVNNGYIMGMGGDGGGSTISGSPAVTTNNVGLTSGGDAIALGVSCTIQNNSYIGGGGGGGGCNSTLGGAGGGAGGGTGGTINNQGTISAGGAGGGIGGGGASGATNAGGGGGRIMPGASTVTQVNGTNGVGYSRSTGGGGGDAGSIAIAAATSTNVVAAAGAGGQAGGSGAVYIWYYSTTINHAGGGGGGWGASGGPGYINGTTISGAGGGFAVRTNGYGVTWSATGTRYGGIG